MREAGGCGQVFKDFKPIHARQATQCPNCSMYGEEQYTRPDGTRAYKICQRITGGYYSPDLDHTDGRTGDKIPMPALGPDVYVGSRRELNEALVRAREQHFQMTNGPHSVLRPFKNPDTGEIVYDKVTTVREGVDLGELHPIETPERERPLRSPFDPSISADDHIRKLSESTGMPMEHPVEQPKQPKEATRRAKRK